VEEALMDWAKIATRNFCLEAGKTTVRMERRHGKRSSTPYRFLGYWRSVVIRECNLVVVREGQVPDEMHRSQVWWVRKRFRNHYHAYVNRREKRYYWQLEWRKR
jgi:hypothetical protein